MRRDLAIVVLLASGCYAGDAGGDGGATDDFIDMDTPPSQCSAGSGAEPCPDPGTTGSPEGGPCIDSQDCAGEAACIAPYVDGEVGSFICTSQCIGLADPGAWCLDESACCDPGVVCSSRGLCVLPEGGSSSGADGTSGDGTTGTATGTTGTGAATGAGTGTGTAT